MPGNPGGAGERAPSPLVKACETVTRCSVARRLVGILLAMTTDMDTRDAGTRRRAVQASPRRLAEPLPSLGWGLWVDDFEGAAEQTETQVTVVASSGKHWTARALLLQPVNRPDGTRQWAAVDAAKAAALGDCFDPAAAAATAGMLSGDRPANPAPGGACDVANPDGALPIPERSLADVMNEAYSQPGWTPTRIDVLYTAGGGWEITNLRLENTDTIAGIGCRPETSAAEEDGF